MRFSLVCISSAKHNEPIRFSKNIIPRFQISIYAYRPMRSSNMGYSPQKGSVLKNALATATNPQTLVVEFHLFAFVENGFVICAMPTPKEQSAFFYRNDSESEMCCLPAQSHFGTLQRAHRSGGRWSPTIPSRGGPRRFISQRLCDLLLNDVECGCESFQHRAMTAIAAEIGHQAIHDPASSWNVRYVPAAIVRGTSMQCPTRSNARRKVRRLDRPIARVPDR
jgi:hypothetical protein